MSETKKIAAIGMVFNVTVAEYRLLTDLLMGGKGMSQRGARKFFEKQCQEDPEHFMYIGSTPYARRDWFEQQKSRLPKNN